MAGRQRSVEDVWEDRTILMEAVWTSDSNLEWRYTQSPINVLFDTTLRLQAIPVRSTRSSTTFSAWRHASRITTFSTPATVSSLYPLLTAVS